LRDGDRLSLGPYEIEIRISETAAAARRPQTTAPNPFETDLVGRPTTTESWLESRESGVRLDAGHDPFAVNVAPPSIGLPPDYDPLAPDPPEEPLIGPTQSDHTPHIEDAFTPPLAHAVLPEDWDRDLGAHPPPKRPPEVSLPPVAAPVREQPAPAAPLPAPAAVEQPAEDLMAAFLRGCGIRDTRPANPVAAMEALGFAFRASVSGLRQAMIARATIKSEFRIEQTMIRSRGNNPLKFSADDNDALAALLDIGRRTDMSAAEAISDALRDVRLHEVATIAAMQSAVRALLEELDPGKLFRAVGRGALDFVPAQRKAHAWDEYEALYGKIHRALEDDFDSIFGKAFARAYERALGDASAREPGG
jgi:type VI secretion system FHA domain protein